MKLEFCTNPDFLRVLLFAKDIVSIVFTIIPIAIVIMTMIDFSKSVTSSSADDQKKKLKLVIKRVLYGIFIFAIPYVVKVIANIIESTFDEELNYNGCLANANPESIAFYQKTYDAEEAIRKAEEERLLAEENERRRVLGLVKGSRATDEQSVIGTQYDLSNEQLEFLATVAQKEQGSVEGAIAEACLMANIFELKVDKNKFGTGADGLVKYVKTGGWFGDAEKKVGIYLQNNKLRDDVKAAVKNVLVYGQRPYPFYIDEHDCWDCNNKKYCPSGFKGDICRIVNYDAEYSNLAEISDRYGGYYKMDETKIYSVYGSGKYDYWTFYKFPTNTSDPFGYTQSALKKYEELNRIINNGE